MSLFLKSQVQAFFDVNGMDVMSADSIPVAETINGYEWVTEEASGFVAAFLITGYLLGLAGLLTFPGATSWMEDLCSFKTFELKLSPIIES